LRGKIIAHKHQSIESKRAGQLEAAKQADKRKRSSMMSAQKKRAAKTNSLSRSTVYIFNSLAESHFFPHFFSLILSHYFSLSLATLSPPRPKPNKCTLSPGLRLSWAAFRSISSSLEQARASLQTGPDLRVGRTSGSWTELATFSKRERERVSHTVTCSHMQSHAVSCSLVPFDAVWGR